MNKINFNTISNEKAAEIFKANKKLQEITEDYAIQSADIIASGQLDYLRSSTNYDIGYCGCWMNIKIGKELEFLEGLQDLQEEWCFLPDAKNKEIAQIYKTMKSYDNSDCAMKPKLEKILCKRVDDLVIDVVNEFRSLYKFDDSDLLETFLDNWDIILDDSKEYYIDDDNILSSIELVTNTYN